MKAIEKPSETAAEAVYKAFRNDVGAQLQKFNFADYSTKARLGVTTPAEDADYMLRQKYGLIPPQLTHSERNLIEREEKYLERNQR